MDLRKFFILGISLLGWHFQSFSIQANFDCKAFYGGNELFFIETHLNFIGGTMNYGQSEDGLRQANIETLIMLKQHDVIIDYVKVNIESPTVIDSLFTDFMDLRRFIVSPGEYQIELELNDLNNPEAETLNHTETITVSDFSSLSSSDVMFLNAWLKTEEENELSRSGYDMLPRVSNLFEYDSKKMGFYTEIYNTSSHFGDSSAFALATYIENSSTGEIYQNSLSLKKRTSSTIVPLFEVKDISFLKEGYYNLVVEVRNDKNVTEFQTKYGFLRGSMNVEYEPFVGDVATTFAAEFTDKAQLYEHLLSLIPVASPAESNTILHGLSEYADINLMQSFFFNFWHKRNHIEPKAEWNKYYELVLAADFEFKTSIKRGYETDRGRIYLEYGKPNTRVINHHTSGAHPFEIWHYYQAGNFTNIKFVFFDNEQSSNDFSLIHSNMRGETSNQNWVSQLLTGIQQNQLNLNRDDAALDPHLENGARMMIMDLYLNPR